MSAGPASPRARLPSIAPTRARAQSALIAALNGRQYGDLRLDVRVAGPGDRRAARGWIECDNGVSLAPLLADGAIARVLGDGGIPSGPEAAATLVAIEPLVAAVESLTGVELHPAELAATLEGDRLVVRLSAFEPGGPERHRALLAVPETLALLARPLAAPPPAILAALVLSWTGAIAGPALPSSRIATMMAGDLLLLGQGAPRARLVIPGRATPPIALLEPGARMLRLLDQSAYGGQDTTMDDRPTDAPPPSGEIKAPIRIEFDGGTMSAAALAALAPGSVLPLPDHGGALPVRLLAGETRWATGELVAIGDGYGVLIDSVIGSAG